MSHLSKFWRGVRTITAAILFAGLGILVQFVFIPLSRWVPPASRRDLRAQRIIRAACLAFRLIVRVFGLLKLRVVGAEGLLERGPTLVVATHPTYLDVGFLLCILPQADLIANWSLSTNSLLRFAAVSAGYLPNDRGAAVVGDCVSRLDAGRWLLMFPEGTRSPEGGVGPLKRGAAHIALESGRDLQPVILTCDPPTMNKTRKWYQIPDRAYEVLVRIEDPIPVRPYLESEWSRPVAARRLTAELESLFLQRVCSKGS